ncbi:muramidase family protein [Salibacterium halotolerans]|uniref:Morphogenetic protein associated with SpoVID n=1 Tax=Salibacterium halotolerans TaxID=1884432 RepID=A0A1I5UFK4_9BACI|nr:SafA/ExsA family spore coat assembly protein [Salibacterium halotolerans]SFP94063.1 morphogenetic protein associated with SpoVID [Salibacterium halotolerans]
MQIYIAQKGDTLWKLAQQYNVSFEEIKQVNHHLADPDQIMPGMKIKIPAKSVHVKKESPKSGQPKETQQKEETMKENTKQPASGESNVPPMYQPAPMPSYPNVPSSEENHYNMNVHFYQQAEKEKQNEQQKKAESPSSKSGPKKPEDVMPSQTKPPKMQPDPAAANTHMAKGNMEGMMPQGPCSYVPVVPVMAPCPPPGPVHSHSFSPVMSSPCSGPDMQQMPQQMPPMGPSQQMPGMPMPPSSNGMEMGWMPQHSPANGMPPAGMMPAANENSPGKKRDAEDRNQYTESPSGYEEGPESFGSGPYSPWMNPFVPHQ